MSPQDQNYFYKFLAENNAVLWPSWFEGEPPEAVWRDIEENLKLVPDEWKYCLLRNGRKIVLVYRHPVTWHPEAAHNRGKLTPDGRPWDGVAGTVMHNPIVRADRLNDRGSANLLLHEYAHSLDQILGWSNRDDALAVAARHRSERAPNQFEYVAELKTRSVLRRPLEPDEAELDARLLITK
jgi:hypothetical protein